MHKSEGKRRYGGSDEEGEGMPRVRRGVKSLKYLIAKVFAGVVINIYNFYTSEYVKYQ